MKKTLAIVFVSVLILASLAAQPAREEYQLVVLSTTDMHGRSTEKDVSTGNIDPNSMLRVKTIVDKVRSEYDNVIVIDNGDTIQGTLVAQYAINYRTHEENPMLTALKDIGYDVWTMGNHEFNFTPEMRDEQTRRAMLDGIAVLSGNVTLIEDGLNVHGITVKSGSPFYDPYVIKTISLPRGKSVKVAIIGLGNAANDTWDLATNYPNLSFSSLENTDKLLEFEIDKFVSEVSEENPDIVIVAAHSGKNTDDMTDVSSFILESQAISGAENSSGVDLIIYGHDHQENIEQVINKEGKIVEMVNGGGTSVTKTVFTLTYEYGKLTDIAIDSELLSLADAEGDEELNEKMGPWYDDTLAWASEPLGTFSGGWDDVRDEGLGKTNTDMILSQTHLLDLIHKAQIWSTWQNYESDGIEGATVSIGSAVFGQNADKTINFVPSDGDGISTLELAKLYRYSNNLMCAVEFTGDELWAWMNAVADMYDVKDGELVMADGVSIYGLDTFYGIDYTIDMNRPKGQRIASATIDNVDIREIPSIKAALNSYRLSGGYGFYEATGKSEADCFWTASQYLGADLAPVPTQIGEYVKFMGTVTPYDPVSHGSDSVWSVIY